MTSPQNSPAQHHGAPIEQHPDVKALGARFDQIAATMATKTLHAVVFLAGAYAAISPWVVGFHGQSPLAINDLLIGGAAALLAVALTTAYERTREWAWVSAVFGIWLVISPWTVHAVHRTTGMLISNIVAGAVIALLGAAAAAMEFGRYRRGRAARI